MELSLLSLHGIPVLLQMIVIKLSYICYKYVNESTVAWGELGNGGRVGPFLEMLEY